jgi:methylase of polypeptide subunit release factors
LRARCAKHDPHHALDGGPDGLAAYRAIAAIARRLLAPGTSWSRSGPGSSRRRVLLAEQALQSRPSGTTCRVSRGRSRAAR